MEGGPRQPHDGEAESREALPSAALQLRVNTFVFSLDVTYGLTKLLPPSAHHPVAREGEDCSDGSFVGFIHQTN